MALATHVVLNCPCIIMGRLFSGPGFSICKMGDRGGSILPSQRFFERFKWLWKCLANWEKRNSFIHSFIYVFTKEKLLCAWHCAWCWEDIGKQDPVCLCRLGLYGCINVYEMMMMILIIIVIKFPGVDESSWMAGTLMTVSDKRCQMSNQKWHTWN